MGFASLYPTCHRLHIFGSGQLVAQRVRRRSAAKRVDIIDLTSPREAVDCAPDLHRWCDLETPFPSVTFGGYLKYYRSRVKGDGSSDEPTYAPPLSKISLSLPPPSSSGWETASPTTTPLFPSKAPTSTASRTPVEPRTATSPRVRHLSIASNTSTSSPESSSPRSLRRKRATYLLAPSIERDFADHLGRLFSPALSITTDTTQTTPTPLAVDKATVNKVDDTSPTTIQRSSSTDSSATTASDNNSTSSGSDLFDLNPPFNRSSTSEEEDEDDFPISPATSVAATEEGGLEAAFVVQPLKVNGDGTQAEKGISEEKEDDKEIVAEEGLKIDNSGVEGEKESAKPNDGESPTRLECAEPKSDSSPLLGSTSPSRKSTRPDSRLSFMTANSEFSNSA
ncbi:hypothetical protein CPB83DRAFT_850639 [Crepidotus variabilis]|uniref:Uncharacterized protein n=1 Tax=Crepidotus variabilis TaxID=179855 RepID=A0A9P6EL71_9AGAR|nr:hypothetical protein CPB83DRAFT_850639 [Crepidotus variabilis]